MEGNKSPGFDRYEISTPDVLKYNRKPNSSFSKYQLPPNRSELSFNSHYNVEVQDSEKTENMVLVFGYPERYREQVIYKFSRLGKVIEIRNGGGNWVYIVYEDKESAQRAIAFNFQFIAEGALVGVVLHGRNEPERCRVEDRAPGEVEVAQCFRKVVKSKSGIWQDFVRFVLNYD